MIGRVVGEKYLLEREIGRGGMGLVWEALDQRLRRRVALKLMKPESTASETLRSRFEREALAIAKLRNTHVLHIYDYGIDSGCPYIVMELLEGEDLEQRLRREQRLSAAALLSLLEQVAKGLDAAHAGGIVHRDLKPANIFMARTDTGETVKIVDFGIVSVQMDSTDEPCPPSLPGLAGTPAYMSPEQLRVAPADARSDLWSLGVVAYEALTGRLPFEGRSFGELFVNVATEEPERPSRLAPELPRVADAFFERALAKDPAQRFQSAAELVAAFAAFAGERPAGPVKVLVVDDERDVALLIEQCFSQQIRSAAYQFVFAGDGEEALEQLRRHPDVAVVLTDINMPRMDGLTLLGRVVEVSPAIRTIVVSAYDDMANIRGAMNRGAFDFLVKPIDFDDLEKTIAKATRHVAESRRSARSVKENDVLRMFVSARFAGRLRAFGPRDAVAGELFDGTVAFVGVGGSGDALKGRPLEEAARQLNANFEVIVPELAAFGGAVDKLVGDAVMAVFEGDDHLHRALEACVAARARLHAIATWAGSDSPYALGIGAGVASSALLAVELGSKASGRLDYAVLGEAVTLAGTLAMAAAAGQILIDDSVVAANGDRIDVEALGPQALPGIAEPLALYNVVGASRRAVREDARELTSTLQAGAAPPARGPARSRS